MHGQGVLKLVEDHEGDCLALAEIVESWQRAGLLGPPTSETVAVVAAARLLDLPVVTCDGDAVKLTDHHGVQCVTIDQFGTDLAA